MRLWMGIGIALVGAGLAVLVVRLPGRKNPVRRDAGAIATLTGVVMLFFWPVLLAGHSFPRGGGDLWGQLYPVWAFVAAQVRQGVFPLWDPLLAAGDPIFSEGQYGLLNPLNWPLFLFSPPPVTLVLLRGMIGPFLAGVGTYLYLTRSPRCQLTTGAGLLGSVAYMLSDPFIVHLGHPQFNDAMAWLPWSLLGVDWALSALSWRSAAMGGLPLAMMVLAGHGQASLYGLLAVGMYGLWLCLLSGRASPSKIVPTVGRLAMVAMVGFALSAPMTLPGIERLPWTMRSLVSPELRRGYEFSPALLADSLAPGFHGRGAASWWGGDRVETAYIGAVAFYLALWGLIARPRRALFWVGWGAVAMLFAFGYQGPLYPLLADWPLFADSWKTARAIFVTAFALAVLAALGMDALSVTIAALNQQSRRRWLYFLVFVILCGGALWMMGTFITSLPGVPAGPPMTTGRSSLRTGGALALGLAALMLVGRVFVKGKSTGRLQKWGQLVLYVGALLLLTGELVVMGSRVETDPSHPFAGPDHSQALAFLRSDRGWFRVDTAPRARQMWSPEQMQIQGLETVQGSGNPLALYPGEQFYWAQPSVGAPGYRLLGVKYIVVPKGAPPGAEEIWPVFTEDATVDIHLNTRALPRSWLVYRTESVVDFEAAFRRVLSDTFQPERVAVVEDGPRLDGTGQGWIEVGRYSPNEVVLTVHTDAPALLVLSDVYYPGWYAELDDVRVPIYRTDVTFRGVLVPPGDHQVRMYFLPRSFLVGLGLAVSVILAWVVTGIHRRARYVQ